MPQQTSEKINLDQTPLIIKQNRKNTNLGKGKTKTGLRKFKNSKEEKEIGKRKEKQKTN